MTGYGNCGINYINYCGIYITLVLSFMMGGNQIVFLFLAKFGILFDIF
jgi:hypothetical protein